MPVDDQNTTIESPSQFEDNPKGWAKRWDTEITASLKMLEEFHKKSDKVVARFLDDRDRDDDKTDSRINLFWSNSKTMMSALYANLPSVDVKRKFADYDDDVARVATNIMERALNYDVMENGKEYETLLKQCLFDRIVPGLGCARVFYEVETEEQEVPAQIDPMTGEELAPAFTEERTVYEAAPCEWYHWSDVTWGWCRTWGELPWLAFRNYMTKDEVKERFGEKFCTQLQFKRRTMSNQDHTGEKDNNKDLWQKAEIWEIWDKDSNQVFWWGKGCDEILDQKDDPLELEGFFPAPQFMVANCTTSLLMPKSDFEMVQDLLNEIDILHTRISILTEAVKVVGVYDRASDGIKRMLMEGVENELIPVDNWAMFAEKGGIQGQIDWLPVEAVVNAIVNLRQLREDNIMLLERITGMSDIIAGSGTHPREGVGTQEMKAEFGSVRIQALEEELAKFVTDIVELKAEIMSKHFEPETILQLSNAQYMPRADAELVPQAIQLIKDWTSAALRVKVRSESMAMVDYSKLKHERTEYINNMALFMQSSAPLVTVEPGVTPYLLEMLKWGMAGFKGSDAIEGVLDRAIDAAQKAQRPQGQDQKDKMEQETAKIRGEIEKEKLRIQGELQKIKMKLMADMKIIEAKFMTEMQKIVAKGEADMGKEEAQAVFGTIQREAEAMIEASLAEAQHDLKLEEIREQASVRSSSESSG